MFREIIATTIVLVFAVSTANAGVIVGGSDCPTISTVSMDSDFENPNQERGVPVLQKNVNNQMQAIEFERPASVCPAMMVEPPQFVFYVSLNGNIRIGNSNLPSPPDLDGLIKPPQKSNDSIV